MALAITLRSRVKVPRERTRGANWMASTQSTAPAYQVSKYCARGDRGLSTHSVCRLPGDGQPAAVARRYPASLGPSPPAAIYGADTAVCRADEIWPWRAFSAAT